MTAYFARYIISASFHVLCLVALLILFAFAQWVTPPTAFFNYVGMAVCGIALTACTASYTMLYQVRRECINPTPPPPSTPALHVVVV